MRRLMESNRFILFVYGCILLCLASYFVIREHRLPHLLENEMPLLFLLRFSVFWFVSLMIAVIMYLVHLSYSYLLLKERDKALARRAGFMTFWLGVAGGTGIVLLLFLYVNYSDYFYLYL
ncbi:hypothetical protein [Pontibacter populi]|uniref:Uncharacterized protein n=1 Tax=Pontibacter populi TaxID=890055 RepID=A0ABV1RU36_9BACT